MYGISTYIWMFFIVNVGTYAIPFSTVNNGIQAWAHHLPTWIRGTSFVFATHDPAAVIVAVFLARARARGVAVGRSY